MTYARDERLALADLLAELGPAQPTLCEGWQTADLAAHLVLREHRPDAGAGVMGGPLAGYTARAQARLLRRTSFADLVAQIRSGPPRLSVFGLPGADARINLVEFFVHHEDVRRAQPDWQRRPLPAGLAQELWQRLRLARLLLRKAPVGVEFARTDTPAAGSNPGESDPDRGGRDRGGRDRGGRDRGGRDKSSGVRITGKAATPVVTVSGDPAELTLWAMGRTSGADVRFDGSDAAIETLRSWAH